MRSLEVGQSCVFQGHTKTSWRSASEPKCPGTKRLELTTAFSVESKVRISQLPGFTWSPSTFQTTTDIIVKSVQSFVRPKMLLPVIRSSVGESSINKFTRKRNTFLFECSTDTSFLNSCPQLLKRDYMFRLWIRNRRSKGARRSPRILHKRAWWPQVDLCYLFDLLTQWEGTSEKPCGEQTLPKCLRVSLQNLF